MHPSTRMCILTPLQPHAHGMEPGRAHKGMLPPPHPHPHPHPQTGLYLREPVWSKVAEGYKLLKPLQINPNTWELEMGLKDKISFANTQTHMAILSGTQL